MKNNTITREMITAAMKDIKTCKEAVNRIICPDKVLAPHKGVSFGCVRVTPYGCWTTINFPQWVKLENEDRPKAFSYYCTETGEFLRWA